MRLKGCGAEIRCEVGQVEPRGRTGKVWDAHAPCGLRGWQPAVKYYLAEHLEITTVLRKSRVRTIVGEELVESEDGVVDAL